MFKFSNHSKFSVLLLLIFSSIVIAHTKTDPCDNLLGTWKGTIHSTNKRGVCDWDVVTTFLNHPNAFVMQNFAYNGHGDHCVDGETFSAKGTCQNGLIFLNEHAKGAIYGKSMIIQSSKEGEVQTMQLAKEEK